MSESIKQRVVVTAGASGIGRAIVDAFLETGAHVHVADFDAVAVNNLPENANLSSSVCDAANADDVVQMFASAREHLESISVLVNCAGIAGPTAVLEDIEPEAWRRCIAVNLDASYLCAQQVIPEMKAANAGSIINMSSTAGLHGYPLRSPYAAAKWGLIGLTKSLAMELGPWGIRVNAICPGSVEGPRMDAVIAAEAKKRGSEHHEVRDTYTQAVSMRTFVSAEDIANMAMFLCSPGGARVSGQAIPVDGHTEFVGTMET
ncbi:MAG: SDR family oxidoreductase [Alphaproteobacteria bacterium]|jgi:NAD(P)-dependent dehydrogenase (short-subunit alcohol dehydrogenase family)|nr:SDR family oxidoreductase [Alphaproteobacteria bacterium]MBT4084740.1 SDR family oxidoreductase [Alphaproteobacteria bacterium]MBT4544696.1 SDR family oxidoreductase [Alphaproteobacteria bacterium]MBT7744890.1 SDR family oxidoreductase [Alphaproteobacteria bacterium]